MNRQANDTNAELPRARTQVTSFGPFILAGALLVVPRKRLEGNTGSVCGNLTPSLIVLRPPNRTDPMSGGLGCVGGPGHPR